MEPIKVKVYGLINFTKKQYIITQSIVFATLLILFALSSFVYNLDKFLLNTNVFIAVIAVLESIETFFVLKKFKEKRAQ